MRQQFVQEDDMQHVITGIKEFYKHMLSNSRVDASEMKEYMERYFRQAGYREEASKLRGKSKSAAKNNIIILHDAGVGDFILMSAVIREIRRTYSKAHIVLMINRFAKDMAECCPCVDEIIPCKDEVLTKVSDFFNYFNKIPEIVKPLLKYRTDVIFNFGHYPSSQLLAYFSGAKERVDLGFMGLDFSFDELSSYQVDWRDFKKSHYNERFLYVLHKYSKTSIGNKSLELWLSPLDKFLAAERVQCIGDKKLYAIVPGGNIKLASKRWSAEKYAQLMNMVLKEETAAFVILGGLEDRAAAEIIQKLVDSKDIIDCVDKMNYRQSAAVLNFCDCYIGNDTGLMHAASALNIPVLSPNCFPADINMTVSAFPALYYPYNVPAVIVQPKHVLPECKKSNIPIGCTSDKPHCIEQITPETMFEGLKILKKQIATKSKEPIFYN